MTIMNMDIEKDKKYEEYVILSNICLDKLIDGTIIAKKIESTCKITERYSMPISGNYCDFLLNIYKCCTFPEEEILMKVESIVSTITSLENMYVYNIDCNKDRTIYKTRHSENKYIRMIKDALRHNKSRIWIHSTDTESETQKVLNVLNFHRSN